MKNQNTSNRIISVTIALFVIIIIVALNILTGIIAKKTNAKIDLTKGQVLSFSDLTYQLLDKIDKDDSIKQNEIKIISIIPENGKDEYGVIDSTYSIINKFLSVTKKISFEKLDPKTDPSIYEKYKQESGENITDYSIIVTYKDKYRVVGSTDMATLSEDGLLLLGAEQSLSSAIEYAVYGNEMKIYVITGHSEVISADYFSNIFSSLHAKTDQLSLINTHIPEDTSLIVINPVNDFTKEEIDEIEKYMQNGGNAIVIYDAADNGKKLDTASEYFKQWGVEFLSGYVAEGNQNNFYQTSLYLLPEIFEHDITKALSNAKSRIICPIATGIDTFEAKNTNVTPLIKTTESGCLLKDSKDANSIFKKGEITICALSEKMYDKGKKGEMVFVGGSGMFSQNFMENPAFSNNDFITNAIKYMIGSNSLLAIRPKNLSATTVNISVGQAKVIMVVTIGIIPLMILAIALAVYIRRKKL